MKLITDEHGQKWEVYRLHAWSFVLVVPLAWDIVAALVHAYSNDLRALPLGLVTIGAILFLLINFQYIYAARIKANPFYDSGRQVTAKKQQFEIWIRKN